MNLNKICPECKTEYMPHVVKCADCGAELMMPEHYAGTVKERKQAAVQGVEEAAVVGEGDLDWIRELRAVLIDASIPCTIYSDTSCKKGCCGDKCKLLVSPDDVEKARERIEEYFMDVDPEFRASKEMISEGKCPACGSPVGKSDRDCPDCGLPLFIVEEK